MPTYLLSLLFLVYVIVVGSLAERVLSVFFQFERGFRLKLFGILTSLASLSWLVGIVIVFFLFSDVLVAIVGGINLLLYLIAYYFARKNDTDMRTPESWSTLVSSALQAPDGWRSLGVVAYLGLAVYGFYQLFTSKTGAAITTPWATISSNYIYIFALATCLLGGLIYAHARTSTLLVLLCIHAFLLHSYLPATHQLLYGADGWRHIAIESRIIEGNAVPEAHITDPSNTTDLVTSLGKVSYSQFWGLGVLLQRFFNISFITIFAWLQPILWSLFVPLLLYEVGQSLGWTEQQSVFFSWLGFLPYAWQAGGAFTLPVTVGLVFWLFLVVLLLKRLANPENGQLFILLAIGVLSIFGYALYFILYWVALLLVEVVRFKEHFSAKTIIFLILLGAAVLPVIEWKAGFSVWPPDQLKLSSVVQFIGNFSAYYLATGPRPHTIATGNIIFDQVPSYAYIANFFTTTHWWLIIFMLGFFCLAAVGWYRTIVDGAASVPLDNHLQDKSQQQKAYGWVLIYGTGLLLAYIVSRYFFSGEHTLVRRLDGVMALILLIFVAVTINHFAKKVFASVLGVALIIAITIGASAAYSLGPDTDTVSLDEYNAMSYIWEQDSMQSTHCVIADTYPLLALEAISGKRIIGGGFPIDHNFAQPELAELERNANDDIGINQARKALEITGADHCWLVLPTTITISYFIKSTGAPVFHFNTIDIWRFTNH